MNFIFSIGLLFFISIYSKSASAIDLRMLPELTYQLRITAPIYSQRFENEIMITSDRADLNHPSSFYESPAQRLKRKSVTCDLVIDSKQFSKTPETQSILKESWIFYLSKATEFKSVTFYNDEVATQVFIPFKTRDNRTLDGIRGLRCFKLGTQPSDLSRFTIRDLKHALAGKLALLEPKKYPIADLSRLEKARNRSGYFSKLPIEILEQLILKSSSIYTLNRLMRDNSYFNLKATKALNLLFDSSVTSPFLKTIIDKKYSGNNYAALIDAHQNKIPGLVKHLLLQEALVLNTPINTRFGNQAVTIPIWYLAIIWTDIEFLKKQVQANKINHLLTGAINIQIGFTYGTQNFTALDLARALGTQAKEIYVYLESLKVPESNLNFKID
jgi:hypothetical protein